MADGGDRRRCRDWIDAHESFRLVELDGPVDEAEFDVCIVDQAGYRANEAALKRRKRTADSMVPYLLLVPQADADQLIRAGGSSVGDGIMDTVDEIVSMPIQPAELEWRLQGLLQFRDQERVLAQRERQMRQTANHLRAVIEASPDAIIVVGRDGCVDEWNPAAERIFGWDRDEVVGEPNPIIPAQKRNEFSAWMAAILDGESHTGLETRRRTKADGIIDVRLSTAPVRDASDAVVGAMAVIEDVSDRNQRQRRLRRFSQAIAATDHAVYITETDGRIQYVNPAFEDITGYSAEEAIGETPRLLRSGTMDDDYYRTLWETVLAGELWHEEIVNRRKSGEHYHAVQTIAPVTDADGELDAFVAIQQDITERKRRDERFKAFIEHSSDVITVLDGEGLIQYNSPSIERILGYGPDELVDEVAFSIVHPDHLERVVAAFSDLVTEPPGRTVAVEYRARHADGTWRWVESVATKRADMPSGTYVVNTRDVTDRVERERELQEAQETRSLALRASEAGIWEWEPATGAVEWDESCERLFGLEPGGFEGTYTAFVDRVHPDDRHDLETTLEGAMAGHDQLRATFRIVRANGVERWVDSRAEVVTDEAGEPVRVLGVIVDVTDRQERVQQLQVLDRVIRHNLRNDLNVINGYTEAIDPEVEGRAGDFLERIRQQSGQLLDTMEKSRSITKVLASGASMVAVDIVPVVDRVIGQVRNAHPSADIAVEAPERAAVRVTEHFEFAMEELITNAIEHNDTETPTVVVSVDVLAEQVRIAVADDGPGIPAMEQKVVTGERDIEPLYHGSGLGLWLVSWVVSRSEGALSFSEREPRGSVVTMEFEREASSPPAGRTDTDGDRRVE